MPALWNGGGMLLMLLLVTLVVGLIAYQPARCWLCNVRCSGRLKVMLRNGAVVALCPDCLASTAKAKARR